LIAAISVGKAAGSMRKVQKCAPCRKSKRKLRSRPRRSPRPLTASIVSCRRASSTRTRPSPSATRGSASPAPVGGSCATGSCSYALGPAQPPNRACRSSRRAASSNKLRRGAVRGLAPPAPPVPPLWSPGEPASSAPPPLPIPLPLPLSSPQPSGPSPRAASSSASTQWLSSTDRAARASTRATRPSNTVRCDFAPSATPSWPQSAPHPESTERAEPPSSEALTAGCCPSGASCPSQRGALASRHGAAHETSAGSSTASPNDTSGAPKGGRRWPRRALGAPPAGSPP
jgi:hypothetical protein